MQRAWSLPMHMSQPIVTNNAGLAILFSTGRPDSGNQEPCLHASTKTKVLSIHAKRKKRLSVNCCNIPLLVEDASQKIIINYGRCFMHECMFHEETK